MRRVTELDALRGLAAMGVLTFHFGPFEGWTRFGVAGVPLFLVLSGYLITGIVMRHARQPRFFRAFYARRILRTWPIYFLTLFGLVVVQQGLPDPPSLEGLPYFLSFTQFVWQWPGFDRVLSSPPTTVHAFDHSWAVAVEWQFYLIWPPVVALIGAKRVGPTALVLVGLGLWSGTPSQEGWTLIHASSALAMGGLIASILDDRTRVDRNRYALSWFFLMVGGLGLACPGWREPARSFGVVAIPFGLVGFAATNTGRWFLSPLRIRELAYLGEISYGLCLYHLPVYWLIGGYWVHTDEPWTMGVTKITLTFVAAHLSYRYLEQPILALKTWFPYETESTLIVPDEPSTAQTPPVPQPRMVYARPSTDEGDRVES